MTRSSSVPSASRTGALCIPPGSRTWKPCTWRPTRALPEASSSKNIATLSGFVKETCASSVCPCEEGLSVSHSPSTRRTDATHTRSNLGSDLGKGSSHWSSMNSVRAAMFRFSIRFRNSVAGTCRQPSVGKANQKEHSVGVLREVMQRLKRLRFSFSKV